MPFVIDEMFERAGKNRKDYFDIDPVVSGTTYHFADGKRIHVPGNLDSFIDRLLRMRTEILSVPLWSILQKFLISVMNHF